MSPAPSAAACPVLVVGAGPVGLTMAVHLHRQGISCRIIDRSPAPTDKSKALVVWGRTLEMLDDLGIADAFWSAGMFLQTACIHGNGRPLVRFPFDVAGTAYPRPLMLAQSETERLLGEHLRQAGVVVERSVELMDFMERGDRVVADLRHADGREEQVHCNWLVGCDGAHSTVRHKVGLEFSGEAEPNDWILADCRVEGAISLEELSLFWHSKGVLAFFPFAPGRCRVIADLGNARAEGRPPDPSLDEVQRVVNERGPAGVRLSEPHWLSGFRIHERKVAEYRRGRVFLAGDAAHIHSPAGGQGMNTGMQDAWNLAWKLALVEKGLARPVLLDSYSPERGEVGEVVLRNAARLTRVAILRNPIAQFFRNLLVRLLGRLPSFRRVFVRNLAEMTIHYPHSPLNGEEIRGHSWTAKGIRLGDRLPDTSLRDPGTGSERRLLKVTCSSRYNLLLLPAGSDHPSLAGLRETGQRVEKFYPDLIQTHLIWPGAVLPAHEGPFASSWLDPSGSVRRLLGARKTALALVRPDGYLCYRGQPGSRESLDAYMNRYLIARPS